MNNYCRDIKDCSIYVRNWIIQQPRVKEESLTDWLLMEISKKLPFVSYKAFSRTEEAKTTGADWEWWFVFKKSSFKLRIQAKKIKKSNNYSSLNYKNKYGLQIDTLISNSIHENAIPLYAFYASDVKNVMCNKNIIDEGVYIAGAKRLSEDFVKPVVKTINPKSILKITNPLSCFLCCTLIRRHSGFKDFIFKYYESEIEIDERQKDTVLGEYVELPNYVKSIMRYDKENIHDELQYNDYLKNANAILIFDLTEIQID